MNRMMVFATVALIACGGVAKKNEQACEDFVAALADCGEIDTTAYEGADYCAGWGEYECDVSTYFSDLTAYLNCGGTAVEGTPPTLPVCE